MKYVSIDIETTGLDPNRHQLLELGAIIEDTENPIPVDDLPRFRMLSIHENYIVSPYCLTLHTELFEELVAHENTDSGTWVDQTTVVIKAGVDFERIFSAWLIEHGVNPLKVVPAGKNFNGFDKGFLGNYIGNIVQFSYRTLDPVALFTRLNDTRLPSLDECATRAGLTFKGSGYHTALADALMVVELLRKGLGLR